MYSMSDCRVLEPPQSLPLLTCSLAEYTLTKVASTISVIVEACEASVTAMDWGIEACLVSEPITELKWMGFRESSNNIPKLKGA